MKKPAVELIALLDELLAGYPVVRRTMFGCPVYFCNGNMMIGVYEDSIFVRLSAADRDSIRTTWDEAAAFSPGGKLTMKEYVTLPDALVSQSIELQRWIDTSLTFMQSLPAKQPKVRKSPARIAPAASGIATGRKRGLRG